VFALMPKSSHTAFITSSSYLIKYVENTQAITLNQFDIG